MDPCPATLALAQTALLNYHTQHSLSLDFQQSLRETSPDVRSKLLRLLQPPGFTKRISPTPEYVQRLLDKAFVGRQDMYIPRMCRLGMEVQQEALRQLPLSARCRSAQMAAKGGHVELLEKILSLSTDDSRLTQEMVECSLGKSLTCDQYLLQHYPLNPQKALMAPQGALEGENTRWQELEAAMPSW